MRFSDIPTKLHMFCMPPDPIVINHIIKYVLTKIYALNQLKYIYTLVLVCTFSSYL